MTFPCLARVSPPDWSKFGVSLTLAAASALFAGAVSAQPLDDDLGAAENTPTQEEPSEASTPTESGDYEPTRPFEKAERERKPVTFGHGSQFGLRVGMTFPFKVNFRMDDSPPCDNGEVPEKKVCPVSTPPTLDLALSFAVLDALEPFVWVRLGLGEEKVTHTDAARLFGAGVRIYTMSESRFKLFIEPSAAIELEGSTDAVTSRNYQTDLLAHLNIGGQFDFSRYFGLFVSAGPEATFFRSVSLAVAGTIGVQGRVP
jgi:hypothetical protein